MWRIDVSAGEVADRLSVLKVKREKMLDGGRREAVAQDLAALRARIDEIMTSQGEWVSRQFEEAVADLEEINDALWETLAEQRKAMAANSEEFPILARRVVDLNSQRYERKCRLDSDVCSTLREYKEYHAAGADDSV